MAPLLQVSAFAEGFDPASLLKAQPGGKACAIDETTGPGVPGMSLVRTWLAVCPLKGLGVNFVAQLVRAVIDVMPDSTGSGLGSRRQRDCRSAARVQRRELRGNDQRRLNRTWWQPRPRVHPRGGRRGLAWDVSTVLKGATPTWNPFLMLRRLSGCVVLIAVAGCGSTIQPSATPGGLALGGSATATSAAISAAGYACAAPTHNASLTFELCQRPQPTENLVPPDSMIRIYSRPDGSVAGFDVDVLGSHASLAAQLTVVLGVALAPTVSPADASSLEALSRRTCRPPFRATPLRPSHPSSR